MDLISVKRQAVCTNFSYLNGEGLKSARKDVSALRPDQVAHDPNTAVIGYDVLGNLSSALSFQGGSFTALDAEVEQQAVKLKEKRKKKTGQADPASWEDSDMALIGEGEEPKASPGEETIPSVEEELLPFMRIDERSSHLEKIVVTADESVYYAIASLLQMVRADILARCVSFGSKLYVLERGKKWHDLASLASEQLELPGAYAPHLKASYIHREALGAPTMVNLPLILLAHMYDHALGVDNFSSLKSPAVYSLYLGCKQRKPGHQFLSGYSEAGPVQYFAQSMASYFSPDKNNKLFTRDVFKVIDSNMYEYLACLFGHL